MTASSTAWSGKQIGPGTRADAEFERRTSHRDPATFRELAQCAAAALLNLVAKMAVPDDDGHFITSVLAIRVDEVLDLLPGSDAPIWFPLGPDVALILHGEERWSPILGQALHGPDLGAVQAVGPSRRIRARCPTVEPIEVPTDAYNGTMVIGERKLFSRSRPARWRIWP